MSSFSPRGKRVDALRDRLSKLFDSGDFSDLTVKCGSVDLKLHQNVICSHIQFFEKACKGGFKESEDKVIDLSADPPVAAKAMLEYCYRLEYNPTAVTQADHDAQIHIEVYALAAKYDIPDLQEYAGSRFEKLANDLWKSKNFCTTIRNVYETTNANYDLLRGLAVKAAYTRIDELVKDEMFCDLLAEIGEFSRDLLLAGISPENSRKMRKCPSCLKIYDGRLVSEPGRAYRCIHCSYPIGTTSIKEQEASCKVYHCFSCDASWESSCITPGQNYFCMNTKCTYRTSSWH